MHLLPFIERRGGMDSVAPLRHSSMYGAAASQSRLGLVGTVWMGSQTGSKVMCVAGESGVLR
eukprot:gene8311-5825_t